MHNWYNSLCWLLDHTPHHWGMYLDIHHSYIFHHNALPEYPQPGRRLHNFLGKYEKDQSSVPLHEKEWIRVYKSNLWLFPANDYLMEN